MSDQPHAYPGREASGRWAARSDSAGWTPHRIDRLLALAARGLSSSMIAADLGGVTRNAVVGKLNRLRQRERKLLGGDTTVREARTPTMRKPRKRRTPVTTKPNVTAPDTDARAHVDESRRQPRLVTLVELRYHHCRWPLGDPRTPEFRFCGADREHEKTAYCPTHHQLARN